MLFIELCVEIVAINTLEKLAHILQREWINIVQNLISQCINTLQIVLILQNI